MALAFATSSDYLSRTSSLLNYNANYTLSFWVKFNALTTFDTLSCMSDGTANNRELFLLDTTTGNKLALRVNVGGAQTTTTGTTVLSTGTWYHVALVRSSATLLTCYLNGASEVTNTRDVTTRAAISDWRIALDQGGANPGNIETAYMKAFTAALSVDQINSERWAARPFYPGGLHAWWPMVAGAARNDDFSGAGRSWTENGSVSSTDGPNVVIWGGGLPPAVTAAAAAPSIPTEPYATWQYFVDWDGDGDFDSIGEEITDYVRTANWRLGMRTPFQSLADKTECTLLLKNHDGRFTPENAASPYYGEMLPGRIIEIRCTYYGVTRTMWRGYVESIQPFAATKRQPDAQLKGTDLKGFAQKMKVNIPLLEGVTADTALLEIFLRLQPPAGTWTGNWIIGKPGLSEIGQTTYLADLTDFYNFEAGTITFPYVGDRWADGVDAYRAALDVVAAERGRLFTARDGRLTFWNRQHIPLLYTPDATIDNEMADMSYAYGQDIANKIKVVTTPRKLTAGATLWTLDDETSIPAGEEKTFRATFTENDAQVSGKDLITPNISDGTLASNGTVTISVTEKARGADITVRNTGVSEVTVTTLILKGTKLTSFNRRETVAEDAASIALYGEHEETLNTELLSDEDYAYQVGLYELNRRAQPRGVVYTITLQNRSVALYNTLLGLTIGSRITVIEDTLYHDSDYVVIGEDHQLTDGGKKHMVTLNLEIGEASAYWLIGIAGRSEIGETTVLGL